MNRLMEEWGRDEWEAKQNKIRNQKCWKFFQIIKLVKIYLYVSKWNGKRKRRSLKMANQMKCE